HCQGAKVNGRIAPLHRELRNGDTVEIFTGTQARPSRDWLSHVRTGRARHKINQWIRQEEEERSLALGRDLLGRELRRRRLAEPEDEAWEKSAKTLGLGSRKGIEAAVGRGDIALGAVIRALHPEVPGDELVAPKPTVF